MEPCDPDLALSYDETMWLRDFVRKCKLNGRGIGGMVSDQISEAYTLAHNSGSSFNNNERDRKILEIQNRLNAVQIAAPDVRITEMSTTVARLSNVVTEQKKMIDEQSLVILELRDAMQKMNPKFGRF